MLLITLTTFVDKDYIFIGDVYYCEETDNESHGTRHEQMAKSEYIITHNRDSHTSLQIAAAEKYNWKKSLEMI